MSRPIGALLGACLGMTLLTLPATAAPTGLAGTIDVMGCSGAVVRLPSSTDDDKALVMTNGHCHGGGPLPIPGEVLVDQPSARLFDVFDDAGEKATTLQAAKALYVTMSGTDLALYETTTTYRRLGVRPLTISPDRPSAGTAIRIVSGSHRQVFECKIDQLIYRVLETGYVTRDVLRYTPDCATKPGTSGSPVVDAASGEVIGINNTSNRAGEQCTRNNPCEMSRDGVITVHRGIGYGTQTHWIATCFDAGNVLDLDKQGCLLPKPGANSSNN